jgi:hypothetical protein
MVAANTLRSATIKGLQDLRCKYRFSWPTYTGMKLGFLLPISFVKSVSEDRSDGYGTHRTAIFKKKFYFS